MEEFLLKKNNPKGITVDIKENILLPINGIKPFIK